MDNKDLSNIDRISMKLNKLCLKKNPVVLANYVYFLMKEYPDCGFIRKHKECLLFLSKKLKTEMNWEDHEIVEFVNTVKNLAKYIFIKVDKN